jgi:hypothetical protein
LCRAATGSSWWLFVLKEQSTTKGTKVHEGIPGMRLIPIILLLTWGFGASATTYYVSSSSGSDANNGTAASTPWQTVGHVNGQTFLPGDSILFRRGDVWNESLIPPSSGSSGNPITFDAYGTGAAPNLTGYYAVPASAWVLVTGNAWKAAVPATFSTINFCLFGSVWGQKVAAATSNLTAQWNFYLANGFVYVYSAGNPATYYNVPIVPMALSNVPVINVNGKSWLTFQHFLVNWFDQYGVYVQGNSDHLVFANMEADSMIPQGTQPLGFYVNESAPGPGDIKIYNAEAHMNYDGFRFDGAALGIALVNDKGYGNRDGGLVDNTSAATYSHCHFYGSSLAVAGSTDVEWTSGTGPIAGAGNIPQDTAPAVLVWQRYPAEVTLTVDDAGMTPGADTYYATTVLPIADAASVPVGAAVTVGYPLAQTLISEFQGWVNAGRDLTSHSMSHTYYTNTDALEIQYIGSGTAATLSISGKVLTITVTGASDSVSYNLAQGQAQGTIKGLRLALAATGKFTATEIQTCQGPYGTGCSAFTEAALLAQDLADVSGQDVRTSVYHMQLDVTRLTTDEITLSRQWMTTNLTGLPATPVYVYPGGYETTTMQGITAGVPFSGARGALKEDLGVKDTYANGFDVQNITSFGVNPSWQGLPAATLNQKIQALVWKQRVWGVPWGIFWHLNELNSTEITNLIQDLKTSGATIQSNTGLVNWLLGGTQQAGTDGNFYYVLPAASTTLDFRPSNNSPVVDAGQNLGTAYALDINGVNQNSYGSGWEIGAHVFQGYAEYGEGAGAGTSKIGGAATVPGLAMLPQVWVNNHEGDALFSYELSLPSTWVTGPAPGCTFHAPYWTGTPTSAGLQSAINDIEGCRTATGVGIALDIPPALYTTANSLGLVIPQSSAVQSSSFLILRSTMDASLPNGQTVCSHGIQDNLASSTDIGIDNPDCTGDAMYYQLGTNITPISPGAFTLANGTVTNTASYNDVQYMWTVESSGGNPSAMVFCSPVGSSSVSNPPTCAATTIAPDHWLIEDMEARMAVGNTGNNRIVNINITTTETNLGQLSSHVHFRKIWVHGDWSSLTAGANSVSSPIELDCNYCSVVDSQTSQSLRPGSEGHSITVQGVGPFKINHNWIEGQSSGIFSGGFQALTPFAIAGYMPFQDVEIRRNRLTFPYAWIGLMTVPGGNTHGWAGQNIERKNALETKNWARLLEDGNIIENSDNSGGQSGVLIDWNVRQFRTNYQNAGNDLTATNNIIRNGCEGVEFNNSGSSQGNGGGIAFNAHRILFGNNLLYNLTPANPGCVGVLSQALETGNTGWYFQGTVTENSAGTAATFVPTCSASGGTNGVNGGDCPGQISGYTIISGGTGCVAGSLTISAPIPGGEQAAGTYTCSGGALSTVTFTDIGRQYDPASPPTATIATGTGTLTIQIRSTPGGLLAGSEVMDFLAGDPIPMSNCRNNAVFNLPLTNYTTGSYYWPNILGPRASAVSNVVGSPSVTFPMITTANATDNGGYCTAITTQGGPENFYALHNTVISNSSVLPSSNNTPGPGPNFAMNFALQNNILISAASGTAWNSNRGEGTPTEIFNYDTASLTADHNVWPGRSGAAYTAYGHNSLFPALSPVMYFPATAYCAGVTPTSSCVGFSGAMSAGSMPLTLTDYHGFGLMGGSSFKAGGTTPASDGTDMGSNVTGLDAAQTQNVYVCQSWCGSGPWSD